MVFMDEIINNLVEKINNKTISLHDLELIFNNEEDYVKVMHILCKNNIIDKYLSSYFKNGLSSEEDVINRYGDELGNILICYGLIKGLIKEDNINYDVSDVKDLSSLSIFYNDIREIPTLTREENLKYVTLYQEAKLRGDMEACIMYRNKLVNGNVRLILSIANKYPSKDNNFQDYISEGFFGLERAIDNFDTSYDCSFSTYATFSIRQKIQRYYYNTGRNIRIPISAQQKFRNYRRTMDQLSVKFGREATIDEIAIAMGESVKSLQDFTSRFYNIVSLDEKLSDDGDEDKYIFVSDDSCFEEDIINKETVEQLLECLDDREKDIIIKRYYNGLTLEQVGSLLNLTRERIRQIEDKALRRMRKYCGGKLIRSKRENNIRIELEENTLANLIGEEKVKDFSFYVRDNSKLNSIYRAAFGRNLDKVYQKYYVNSSEASALRASIKRVIETEPLFVDTRFNGKTLTQIYNLFMQDNEDEKKNSVSEFWDDAMYESEKTSKIFKKAFGNDGTHPCRLYRLDSREKYFLIEKLRAWGRLLQNDESPYLGKQLNEILGLSYKATLDFVNSLGKDSLNYKSITYVFGTNLREKLSKYKFTDKDYVEFVKKINSLKRLIKRNNIDEKTTRDFSNNLKYYNQIVELMPSEYKNVLSLYIGLSMENNAVRQVAKYMGIPEEDAAQRIKEGLVFIEGVIKSYNEAFDKEMPVLKLSL